MTALCPGGGSSTSRPEFSRFTFIAPAVIGAALNNIETKLAMAIAGAVGGITFDLSTFCTTDPPAMPTITSDDVFALLNPIQVEQYAAAIGKFNALVLNYLWPQLCICASDPQPSVPTAPTGITSVSYNPPQLPSYPSGQPCLTLTRSGIIPSGNSTVNVGLVPLPSGASYATLDAVFEAETLTVNGQGFGLNFWGYDSNGTFQSSWLTAGQSRTAGVTTTIKSAAGSKASSAITQGQIVLSATNLPAALNFSMTVNVYCGTQPGGSGAVPNPCPPDPLVQSLLEQIKSMVTLIQRQHVPFAYVQSTLHSGLTGSGEISVADLIGAIVTVTAHGTNTGVELADPDVLFEAGWFSWGNADGFAPRTFINCSPQISLPDSAGQYTRIAYTLPVGTTISIRELTREP